MTKSPVLELVLCYEHHLINLKINVSVIPISNVSKLKGNTTHFVRILLLVCKTLFLKYEPKFLLTNKNRSIFKHFMYLDFLF